MAKNILMSAVIILLGIVTNGCGSSNYIVQPGVRLDGYKNVFIPHMVYKDDGYDIYGIEKMVSNTLAQKGMTLISEEEYRTNPISEAGITLVCLIEHNQYQDLGNPASKCTITFVDYENKKIFESVATDRAATVFESVPSLIEGAAEKAIKNFTLAYHGFNKLYARDIQKEMQKKYANTEKIGIGEDDIKTYFDKNIERLDPVEGIWTDSENNQYQIAILRDSTKRNRDFVAVIISADSAFWMPGQVKAEYQKTAYNTAYTTTWYMRDHSKQGMTSFLKDNGLLEFELKNPKPSNNQPASTKSVYIKNYPRNIGSRNPVESKSNQSSGSGFLLSESGIVTTNWHVVNNATSIKVFFPQFNKSFTGTIALKDASNDIALIRLNDFKYADVFNKKIPYSITSSHSLKQGQKLFTLGFPLGDILGKEAKLSDGIINSLYGLQDDPRLIQISNPIQPGNSGGPLLNPSGEIVGIVVATLNAKYFYEKADIIPQNVNFAIKGDYLLNLISLLPEDSEIKSRNSQLINLSFEKQVEAIAPFVVNIKTE